MVPFYRTSGWDKINNTINNEDQFGVVGMDAGRGYHKTNQIRRVNRGEYNTSNNITC